MGFHFYNLNSNIYLNTLVDPSAYVNDCGTVDVALILKIMIIYQIENDCLVINLIFNPNNI